MPKIEEKQKVVQELAARINESNLVVLVDYRGLKVAEMTELRSKLREAGADLRVVKNTMTRLALQNTGDSSLEAFFEGPNAVSFSSSNEVEVVKTIFDFARVHKNLSVKAGMLDHNVLDADQLKTLSTLPPREVLLAQVVGGIQAPLYGLAYVLKANLSGLVRALDGVRQQKEAS